MKSISKLNTLAAAIRWKENAAQNECWLVIIHGDDGLFWIVSGKEANELCSEGYERVDC